MASLSLRQYEARHANIAPPDEAKSLHNYKRADIIRPL